MGRVFGPLADVVRIEWILLATGTLMFLLGVLALGRKRLMEAGLPAASAAAVNDASAHGACVAARGGRRCRDGVTCLPPAPPGFGGVALTSRLFFATMPSMSPI